MGNLTTLLIGHRGAGKTALLERFKKRYSHIAAYDLDQEIAASTGESVSDIFTRSEAEFRNHERRVLEDLMKEDQPKVIVLGAGFEGPLPKDAHVIWVRRITDSSGRVFQDRPRLNKNVSLFDEYHERFAIREKRYRAWAHEVLTLPEGDELEIDDASSAVHLCDFLILPKWTVLADLTVLPENLRDWKAFWEKRKSWDLQHLEVRDDLLRPDQIETVLKDVPTEKIIYGCREEARLRDLKCDWPWEMGKPPGDVHILSLHRRDQSLETILKTFTDQPAAIHKLAIEIRDFHELKRGHLWWLEDPTRRAFLPHSENGRWRWYRSLFGPRMPLNYIREGDGSSPDQPFLWQTLMQPPLHQHFAAVLGSPVDHSRSPLEHRTFFNDVPFVSIEVGEKEFSEALSVLAELGLKYAAVTAPLKKVAALACKELTSEADSLRAVNTLAFTGDHWKGHNTDVLALMRLREEWPSLKKVWLWGGGGIKSSIKRVWPEAREISAREGTESMDQPDLVIWATGRTRDFKWPQPNVRPKLVLDLNYGEDSPGLEWAVRENLSYQSGLKMFKLQAEAQREFWKAEMGL